MKKIINIDKIITFTLIALIIFLPLRELLETYVNIYLKLISDALVVTLFIISIFSKKLKFTIRKSDIFFIVFLIIGAISTGMNGYSIYTYLIQLRSVTTYYLLYFILRNYILNINQTNKINTTLKITTVILFIHSILEVLFNKMILFPSIWATNIKYADNFTRSYGLFNNPNTLAIFALMTYIFLQKYNKKNNILYKILLITIILLTMSRSTLIFLIIYVIYEFITNKSNIKEKIIKIIIPILISIITLFSITFLKNTINYKNERQNTKDDNIQINDKYSDSENETSDNIVDRIEEITSNKIIESSKYNGRLYSINKGFEIFIDYPILGTGFGSYGSASSLITNSKIYDKYNIEKGFYADNEYIKVLVETGIIGFIFYLLLCINILKDNKNNLLVCLMFFGYGMFLNNFELKALCLMFYLILIASKKAKYIEKNKVTIFSLHLNYGGIEKNICTKANILSKKYNVEIISLYKLTQKPVFYLDKKVKVTYLTQNIKPNREEFNKALKSKNIIKIIKEGLYSIKVLYLKNKLLNESFKNCNSEIIISTRIDFTEKLIKYNEYKNIKIAEEHIYHNNDKKYLKKLNKILKKVDYLMPSSNYLTKFYKDKFLRYSYKIKTNNMPIESNYKLSTLKNKTIISVGRLSKEKAFDDLIKIFSKIKDKDWTLNIIGDGPEYNNLANLITKLNLNNRVKLLGFKTTEELNELYEKASIYMMTSLEESFGLVLLEAASHGLPIISYSSALGACEILNGNKGILIENRNEQKMLENLNILINDIKIREQYQQKSLSISSEYKYEIIEKKVLELFNDLSKTNLFTNLYTSSKNDCLNLLDTRIKNKEKTFIVTANAETYMMTEYDKEINLITYNKNNLVVPDGILIVKAANFLGYKIKERITGIELAEYLLKKANEKKLKVYMFGASVNVIEKLENVIKESYPNINLVGASNGYIKDKDSVMEYIKTTKPDIIMLALGIPLQEKLFNNHINEFDYGIFIGVGGSFDVISGSKKRAPKIFIKLNLEWLYRITSEPKRIARFIKHNIRFLIKIFKEK